MLNYIWGGAPMWVNIVWTQMVSLNPSFFFTGPLLLCALIWLTGLVPMTALRLLVAFFLGAGGMRVTCSVLDRIGIAGLFRTDAARAIACLRALGFTTLALAIGGGKEFSDVEGAPPGAPRSLRRRLVQVAMRIEGICARRASAHLAVTHAMSTWLSRNLGIEANRFHDSPPDFFKSTVVAERHDLFTRLRPE